MSEPLQVTFDKSAKQFVWNLLRPFFKDKTCPFCHTPIRAKNFAGAIHYEGEPRPIDGNFICLIELAKLLKETA